MPPVAAPSKFGALQLRRRALGPVRLGNCAAMCSKSPDTFRNPIPFATRYLSQPDTFRNNGELERTSGQTPTSEASVMNKTLLYMAPIALVGLLGIDTPAKAAVWNGSLAPNIAATTAEQTDAPTVLVRGGGGRGGGGGGRGGGGGYRGGGAGARGGGG